MGDANLFACKLGPRGTGPQTPIGSGSIVITAGRVVNPYHQNFCLYKLFSLLSLAVHNRPTPREALFSRTPRSLFSRVSQTTPSIWRKVRRGNGAQGYLTFGRFLTVTLCSFLRWVIVPRFYGVAERFDPWLAHLPSDSGAPNGRVELSARLLDRVGCLLKTPCSR